jgi:hypothetical protein
VALARQQGKVPLARFEDIFGLGAAGEEEFDVDAFLAARERWQSEDRLRDDRLAELDDMSQ